MMEEEERENGASDQVSADEVAEGAAPEDGKETGEPAAKAGDDGDSGETQPKRQQSKAMNAKFAAERREREARAKAEREAREAERKAYVKGQLDTLRTNPYTDEPISDEIDLEQYKLMRELDEAGKDPVRGFAKAWAERTRSEEAKKADAEKESQAKSKADADRAKAEVDDLLSAYPGTDTAALAKDEGFQRFASGKYGRWTLTEIYEAYKAKDGGQAGNRARRSSPSSLPGGTNEPKSLKDMTDDEFLAYRMEKYGH